MSSSEIAIVTPHDYVSRLRAVLGPGCGGGFPRRQRDRLILLHALSRWFREDEHLSEKDATQRIESFLLVNGTHLDLDAVTLRRALVDEGFVDRDPAGRDYRASRRFEQRIRFDGEMPDVTEALAPRDLPPDEKRSRPN
jgi:hypothetical protein